MRALVIVLALLAAAPAAAQLSHLEAYEQLAVLPHTMISKASRTAANCCLAIVFYSDDANGHCGTVPGGANGFLPATAFPAANCRRSVTETAACADLATARGQFMDTLTGLTGVSPNRIWSNCRACTAPGGGGSCFNNVARVLETLE